MDSTHVEIRKMLNKLMTLTVDQISAFKEKATARVQKEMPNDPEALEFINLLFDCALKRAAA